MTRYETVIWTVLAYSCYICLLAPTLSFVVIYCVTFTASMSFQLFSEDDLIDPAIIVMYAVGGLGSYTVYFILQ